MSVNLHFDAKRIKRLRAALGLTQTQFGKRIGAAQTTVSMWESGNTHPQHTHILEALLAAEKDAGITAKTP